MKIENAPFAVTDWDNIEPQTFPGETGDAVVKTFERGNVRVRKVVYSPGYLADHWCLKGHVVYIIEGEIEVSIEDGRKFALGAGSGFVVADGIDAHKAYTANGATAFIVD